MKYLKLYENWKDWHDFFKKKSEENAPPVEWKKGDLVKFKDSCRFIPKGLHNKVLKVDAIDPYNDKIWLEDVEDSYNEKYFETPTEQEIMDYNIEQDAESVKISDELKMKFDAKKYNL